MLPIALSTEPAVEVADMIRADAPAEVAGRGPTQHRATAASRVIVSRTARKGSFVQDRSARSGSRRAARRAGSEARDSGDGQQDDGNGNVGQAIVPATPYSSVAMKRVSQAEASRPATSPPSAIDQSPDAGPARRDRAPRAERRAQRQLARPLRDGVGQHAEQTDAGDDQRDDGEAAQQHGVETRPRERRRQQPILKRHDRARHQGRDRPRAPRSRIARGKRPRIARRCASSSVAVVTAHAAFELPIREIHLRQRRHAARERSARPRRRRRSLARPDAVRPHTPMGIRAPSGSSPR